MTSEYSQDAAWFVVAMHRRIQGDAKEVYTPRGSGKNSQPG